MSENLAELLRVLPANLANHLLLTVVPLAIGAAISVPLAVGIAKVKPLRYPTLTVVSIVQTIPSLALLALMVPLLVGLSVVTTWAFGTELPVLGFLPAAIALTLYSMLPMLRNTVTGILGVPEDMLEAARGLGMTSAQILRQVELPLAAPVILAGVRTAAVWTVGMATLATPVGQRSLGNYIFAGLQTRNLLSVVLGCVFAAGVAIVLDLLLGGLERAVARRSRALGWLSVVGLVLFFAGGLVSPALVRGGAADAPVVKLGSKTFTEQYILVQLIRDVLEADGFKVKKAESLGSTVLFEGLVQNQIDAYVDYSGTIWANHMKRTDAASPQVVLDQMTAWLIDSHGVLCLGSLGFENAYGLAMRREQAEALGIRSIGDLAAHSRSMKIGGDYEFFQRPEWKQIRQTYGLHFQGEVSYDPTFMYEAVASGTVDVISAFTSDGRIAALDLVVLQDPLRAIPPYDAVLLLSPQAAQRKDVVRALTPLVGAIPVERMREANYRVDRDNDKQTVAEAAAWLRTMLTNKAP